MLVAPDYLIVAESILRSIVERSNDEPTRKAIHVSMMLCLIGQGKFEKALECQRPIPTNAQIVDAFNFAMAEWGATRIPPLDFFSRVLELASPFDRGETPKNVFQCLSISASVMGDRTLAHKFWHRAVEASDTDSADSFSAWRYLRVSPAQFRDDLGELKQMLDDAAIVPRIFRDHWERH